MKVANKVHPNDDVFNCKSFNNGHRSNKSRRKFVQKSVRRILKDIDKATKED